MTPRPGFGGFVAASLLVHGAAAGLLHAGSVLDAFAAPEMAIDLTGSFRTRPARRGLRPVGAAMAAAVPEAARPSATPNEESGPPGAGGPSGVPDGMAGGGDPLAPLVDITALPELLDRSGLRARLEPFYPPALKAAGVEGVVTLEVVVSSGGWITAARAVRSDPPGFEEAAVAVCRELAFRPARVGARPVAAKIRLPLRFQIER